MFLKSLALNPKDLDTWYFLGRASYSADPAAAVDSYRHALERGAPQGRVYEHLGRAYELLGQAADADKSYRRALELAGDSFSPYFAYGTFLFKAGRIADSLPVLEQALRREPGSAEARLELSRALFHAGETEQALGVLQPARESNDCRVHQLLLRLFTLKANTREADKELNFLETCRP